MTRLRDWTDRHPLCVPHGAPVRRVASACATIVWVAMAWVAAASSATALGAQVRVGMRGQRFTPARIVVTAGDSVRFDLESGGPHNIAFNADSIPPGSLATLARNLGAEPRPLIMSLMLLDPGESYVLSSAGLPPGTYPFYCAPHYGGGMRGELVVLPRAR